MTARRPAVSVVIPVRNGAPWIHQVVRAIWDQHDGRAMEVIAVDDGSEDGSERLLQELATEGPLRILRGPRRGAAAAVNAGILAAQHPIVCQIDQDVILEPGWIAAVTAAFNDPRVAAVQGYYRNDARASLCARAMALDLEDRYESMARDSTDHVCTGNAAYRRTALLEVGLFDEQFGYGYDNDLSYRLRAAGYELVFCRTATSLHRWRDGLVAYCRQQYGFGYGRLDLVAKHPARITGDAVSPWPMMLHAPGMLLAVLALAAGTLAAAGGRDWRPGVASALVLVGALAIERAIAGLRTWRRSCDPAALLFPVLHLVRDVVWVVATAVWTLRRLRGRPADPSQSMRPRPALPDHLDRAAAPTGGFRVLALIPAHNEALNLPAVIDDLADCCPSLDVLVIDDGSTDDTPGVLRRLGVRSLRFDGRMGIGSAMREGLRHASVQGYDVVVRLDGDGQHRASDIEALIGPLLEGRADVVLGSRYIGTKPRSAPAGKTTSTWKQSSIRSDRLAIRLLAGWLSMLTGRPVTDPTSGFCAFGPKAVRLLAQHHPTGYPEPELQLVVTRSGLRAMEVPVDARPRLAGRTSLTPWRVATAGARVLVALVIEPLRPSVGTDA